MLNTSNINEDPDTLHSLQQFFDKPRKKSGNDYYERGGGYSQFILVFPPSIPSCSR